MSRQDRDDGQNEQAYRAFDTSGDRFLAEHSEDSFSGASGVLFERAMAQTRMAICLVDPHQEDQPIVFANRAFRVLTGYEEDEIIGRNCRFLQGPKTKSEPIRQLRSAIENEDVVVVELLNYRKDGSTFWNALHIGPIYDDDGKLAYLFGSQWDVSDVRAARSEERHARAMARELSHRMKNMFSVISGIVNITGRVRGIEEEAKEINARIHALGRAYETTLDEASSGSIDVGPAIHAILAPYQADKRLVLKGRGVPVSFAAVSTIGVILQELADNAIRYGAWKDDVGEVEVAWRKGKSDGFVEIDWVETGGPAVDGGQAVEGAGVRIIDRLLKVSSGSIERNWTSDGLHAKIELAV